MSAYTFNVTLNNETSTKRNVVEAVVYNQTDNARGEWSITLDDGKVVWNLFSGDYKPGSSGALRIKPQGSNETGYIAAFGYWYKTGTTWIGIVEDLLPDSNATAATVIPLFYGDGFYNKEGVYFSWDLNFQKRSDRTGETVAIALTIDEENKVVKAVVTVHD